MSIPIKAIISLVGLFIIVMFLKWIHDVIDQGGYERAQSECQAKVIAAIKAEDEKNKNKLAKLTESRDKWKAEAESKPDVAETIEVIEHVTETIHAQDYSCSNLYPAFTGVFNDNRERIFSGRGRDNDSE